MGDDMANQKNETRSRWMVIIASEVLIFFFEILLLFIFLFLRKKQFFGALLFPLFTDLVLVSPLKAGRSYLYIQLVKSKPVNLSMLFNCGGSSYFRIVIWRVYVWLRYVFVTWISLFPAASIFVLINALIHKEILFQNNLLYIGLSFANILCFIVGGLFAWLLTVKYDLSGFLLSEQIGFLELFRQGKKIFQTQRDAFAASRCRLLLWTPLFLLIVPYFYAVIRYRTKQAKLICRSYEKFVQRNPPKP